MSEVVVKLEEPTDVEEPPIGNIPPKKKKPIQKRNKKFTEDENLRLIDEVRKRPCLWNYDHPNFKSIENTKKEWEEVGIVLNFSRDIAKKKWKNLKDIYRKIIQGKKYKSGAEKWKYYEAMHFIRSFRRRFFIPREGGAHDAMQEVTSHIISSSYASPVVHESEPVQLPLPEESVFNLSIQEDGDTSELLKDSDYHFFLSLLPYVRRMRPMQKLEFRNTIQNCILESFMNHSKKNPPKNPLPLHQNTNK